MNNKRVIPALLLKGEGFFKTTKFKNPSYIGDPINAIKIFNDKEVDEIMVLDIEASKIMKKPNFDLIANFSSECFMPLTYGGGISSLRDVEKLFSIGVEKVCLQSLVFDNLNLLKEMIYNFGSSSIVVSLDVKKNFFSSYKVFEHRKNKINSVFSLEELLSIFNEIGVGEVLLNNVDLDGTMNGPDQELIRYVSRELSSPVVALGGVGSKEDLKKCFENGASAVAAGAFFVYHGPHRAVLISYPSREDFDYIFGLG